MIFIEDQHIKLNGVVLPGVIKSMEIKSSARIDEQTVEGSAVKPKQATGYEDAKITLDMIVDDTETQTRYQRFAVLRSIFRAPGQAVPQPIPIVCEDAAAHGITKVLFKEITHKVESKRDALSVTVELWEYVPQTIKTTKASTSSTKKAVATSGGNALTKDYKSYLTTNRGKAAATSGGTKGKTASPVTKVTKSPAKDTAKTSTHLAKIRAQKKLR